MDKFMREPESVGIWRVEKQTDRRGKLSGKAP